jgi:UDP-glucose 4-epimerase
VTHAGRQTRSLVTGGAGFIGSHLADHLLAAGQRVLVVDDLSTGRRENLAEHEGLEFIHADLGAVLADLGEGRALGPVDRVYHLAAAVGVKLVMERPDEAIETNVTLTSRLLRAALSIGPAGGPAPTLIASSSEVYGKGTGAVFSEEDDVLYGPTTVTRWSYAASKALDEHLALAFHRRHGLPAVIARFFNTVGPRQVGDYGMVLPRFVAAALAGEPLVVFGDGTQSRCFVDVRDVAPALHRLLRTPGCVGRVFNLGADTPITIRALAETVVRVLGSSSRIITRPYSDAYPQGFEDLRRRRPDLTRLREAVGFEPATPIETTIADLASALASGSRR